MFPPVRDIEITLSEELTFPSLIYPNDMSAANFYPDCVCFTIQKRTGVSISDVTAAGGAAYQTYKGLWQGNEKIPADMKKTVEDALTKNKENGSKQTEQAVMEAATNKWKKDHPKVTILPEHMFGLIKETVKEFALKMQKAQTKALEVGKDGSQILGSIYMNMPNGIQFDEKANWAGDSLGFMGKMSQDLVGGGGDASGTLTGAVAGSAGNILGGAIGAIPSLVSKLGISGGMFGAAIGAMAAGSPMQKGAESALGIAQNPYMEMMFSGIGFRTFNFEFIMRPRNTDEVQEVAKILRQFRTFTKPTFTEGVLGKSFMDYPMEFKIEFLTSGEKLDESETARIDGTGFEINPHIPRLKNCVCDSVTSNFTPQSIWAAHEEGVPVAVTLGLNFQETELVMAEDVHGDGGENKGGY